MNNIQKNRAKHIFKVTGISITLVGVSLTSASYIARGIEYASTRKSIFESASIVEYQEKTILTSLDNLNEFEDINTYSADDCRKEVINNSEYDTKYRDMILEFINDVENTYPKINWFLFYHNIKRNKTHFIPEKDWTAKGIVGLSYPGSGEIKIRVADDDYNLEDYRGTIYHELCHLLFSIEIEFEKYTLKITTNLENNISMEWLLCKFNNSLRSDVSDNGKYVFNFYLKPLVNEFGLEESLKPLISSNYNELKEMAKIQTIKGGELIDSLNYFYARTDSLDDLPVDINEKYIYDMAETAFEYFLENEKEILKRHGEAGFETYLMSTSAYVDTVVDSIVYTAKNTHEVLIDKEELYLLFYQTEKNILGDYGNKINIERMNFNQKDNNLFLVFDMEEDPHMCMVYKDDTKLGLNYTYYFIYLKEENDYTVLLVNKENLHDPKVFDLLSKQKYEINVDEVELFDAEEILINNLNWENYEEHIEEGFSYSFKISSHDIRKIFSNINIENLTLD